VLQPPQTLALLTLLEPLLLLLLPTVHAHPYTHAARTAVLRHLSRGLDPKSLYARSILDKINPNRNQNSPAGLDGLNQRFVRFGGAVGPRQLLWLKMQLEEAGDAK
jgi:hypothetical protein